MKSTIVKLSCFVMITTASVMSCTNPTEKNNEKVEDARESVIIANKELDKARKDSADDYNQYKMATESRIRENDSLLIVLNSRIVNEKNNLHLAYKKELQSLEESNKKLKAKIDSYKENDKNKWESFKLGFNQDMNDLGKSISALAQKNINKK